MKITIGTYNTKYYSCKEYNTLSGFKRGLKAANCPFEVDKDGLFTDINGGKLNTRNWNYRGLKYTAINQSN